jgi:UDP-N-acetylglucosamine 2-epimerase (non-hydrolysing)
MNVLDFHNFIKMSYLILSDSGGVQEEASALGKPMLVLRDTTERPEGVEAGTLRLVGTNEEHVYKNTYELLSDKSSYNRMSHAKNPYGDGFASRYIVDYLLQQLTQN